jgi:hypothetical protein
MSVDSIGLENEWVEIGEYLEKIGSREAVILGTPLGPEHEPFDPGGIGSTFRLKPLCGAILLRSSS